MKAVVFRGVGDVRLEDVDEPEIEQATDAIVRITASAICGTDLHMVRGTMPGMKPGTILGHEAVGVVEAVGADVKRLRPGDRVVIPSTIACGACRFCEGGSFAQCDRANPNGPHAGTAFFGGPVTSGPFDGLQAERARVPFADVGPVKLADDVDDEDAILLSDILPTAWFGCDLAGVRAGDTVAVFGCGPVGQLAIACAKLLGASRVFAVDCIATRLEMARAQGAEIVDFDAEQPALAIRERTSGMGVHRAIDAVGIDAVRAHRGPAAKLSRAEKKLFSDEVRAVAPEQNEDGDNWHPGDAPTLALAWAAESLAKCSTLGVVGVYPETARRFPIGVLMMKNATVRAGNCNHKKYIPMLADLVRSGTIAPKKILTQREPMGSVIEAYEAFDRRMPGWVKVELVPRAA